MTKERKSVLDELFDAAERVVDGAAGVLSGVPDPDEEELSTPKPESRVQHAQYGKVIDVQASGGTGAGEHRTAPLLKSDDGQSKKPREVTLGIKNVSSRRRGGVNIMAETPTHELVCIVLSEEDWKKVCDAADWMRMVPE